MGTRPRFLVLLTLVRPIATDEPRDERGRPERIVETVGAVDRAAAERIFSTMCGLPAVRLGRMRAKIVDVAGQDTWDGVRDWSAPLITDATRRALVRLGTKRAGGW